MKQGMNLYFVAIIPTQELCDEITAIKQEFATRFGSKHALKVVPHITLKAPFSINLEDHHIVVNWFNNLPTRMKPFEQTLENFGCFDNKKNPVIFIEPVMNESLSQLQKNIVRGFKSSFPSIQVPLNEMKFHPHVTVAYRDLTFSNFQLAWDEYIDKKFHAVFMVDKFHLLQHNGKQWNSIAAVHLQ